MMYAGSVGAQHNHSDTTYGVIQWVDISEDAFTIPHRRIVTLMEDGYIVTNYAHCISNLQSNCNGICRIHKCFASVNVTSVIVGKSKLDPSKQYTFIPYSSLQKQ